MYRILLASSFCAITFTPVVLHWSELVTAQVMTGSSYQIESDSINFGGGLSDSDSFSLKDTLGEVATGDSESDNFQLRAGYRQMQAVAISVSSIPSVIMDTPLAGVTGGTSNGSTTITVITDSPAGYEFLIAAESSPAMQGPGEAFIADYAETGDADFRFASSSPVSHLGFSVVSVDASPRFRHSESNVCGAGSINTPLRCWVGLSSTTSPIAVRNESNHPDGTEIRLNFQIVVDGIIQIPGTYRATSTVTAIPL